LCNRLILDFKLADKCRAHAQRVDLARLPGWDLVRPKRNKTKRRPRAVPLIGAAGQRADDRRAVGVADVVFASAGEIASLAGGRD